ncbi:MAG: DUF6338 family protein [Pseudonocardiaceae bacterium]
MGVRPAVRRTRDHGSAGGRLVHSPVLGCDALWCWLTGKLPEQWLPRVKKHAKQLRAQTANPSGLRYDATPTAWDWAVDQAGSLNGFVRVCDAEGHWWGGAFGSSSYFSDYP